LSTIIQTGITTPDGQKPGVSINGLALSRTTGLLYIAVGTGGGGGRQPGGLLAVDIYLYRDAHPDEARLQADLSQYLVPTAPRRHRGGSAQWLPRAAFGAGTSQAVLRSDVTDGFISRTAASSSSKPSRRKASISSSTQRSCLVRRSSPQPGQSAASPA